MSNPLVAFRQPNLHPIFCIRRFRRRHIQIGNGHLLRVVLTEDPQSGTGHRVILNDHLMPIVEHQDGIFRLWGSRKSLWLRGLRVSGFRAGGAVFFAQIFDFIGQALQLISHCLFIAIVADHHLLRLLLLVTVVITEGKERREEKTAIEKPVVEKSVAAQERIETIKTGREKEMVAVMVPESKLFPMIEKYPAMGAESPDARAEPTRSHHRDRTRGKTSTYSARRHGTGSKDRRVGGEACATRRSRTHGPALSVGRNREESSSPEYRKEKQPFHDASLAEEAAGSQLVPLCQKSTGTLNRRAAGSLL